MDCCPGLARLAYLTAPYVLIFMVVVHGAEAAHMARGRLRRHSVETFSGVWWAWVVDTFFEGFGAFQRFDGMVEKRRKEKGSGKERCWEADEEQMKWSHKKWYAGNLHN